MSRDIHEDLEVMDGEASERMDELFASLPPASHAARIVALASAPEIRNEELTD